MSRDAVSQSGWCRKYMQGFDRCPSGDFKGWLKMAEGLFLDHSCWKKEFNNFEKALNKKIFASGSKALKNEGEV